MSGLLWNILLAGAWAAFTGDISPLNLALGGVLGAVILAASREAIGVPHYPTKLRQVLSLAVFFVWELLVSNVRVARDVIRPRTRIHPAVIAMPLRAKTEAEITLLASFITLTPGSTSIDVTPDRRFMYVHVMNTEGSSPAEERAQLSDGFERRILEVTRFEVPR